MLAAHRDIQDLTKANEANLPIYHLPSSIFPLPPWSLDKRCKLVHIEAVAFWSILMNTNLLRPCTTQLMWVNHTLESVYYYYYYY